MTQVSASVDISKEQNSSTCPYTKEEIFARINNVAMIFQTSSFNNIDVISSEP